MVALLLCHGVYGFEHQLAEHQPGMAQGMSHPAHPGPMDAHHTAPKGDDSGRGAMPNGGYFAVLIPMLLAVVLWTWCGVFRVPDAREAVRFTTRPLAPLAPYPPRGPTPYLFQVMRL